MHDDSVGGWGNDMFVFKINYSSTGFELMPIWGRISNSKDLYLHIAYEHASSLYRFTHRGLFQSPRLTHTHFSEKTFNWLNIYRFQLFQALVTSI